MRVYVRWRGRGCRTEQKGQKSRGTRKHCFACPHHLAPMPGAKVLQTQPPRYTCTCMHVDVVPHTLYTKNAGR